MDRGDLQLVADQLVVVLRVGDRRLQELHPRLGGAARCEGQDSPRLLDVLAADVIAHEPRLAGGGADVPRLGADEHGRLARLALGARLVPLARGLVVALVGRLAAAPAWLGRRVVGRGHGPGGRRLVGRLVVGLALGGRVLGVGLLRARLAGRLLRLVLLGGGLDGGRLGALLRGRLLVGVLGARHGLRRLLGDLLLDLLGGVGLLLARGGAHRTLPLPAWPRYRRVGANSPSLWPTIDSDTNTGTCLRPSCTAMVWPTISGKIVDVRDQVRIMVLVLALFMSSMRRMRRSSTNGPFLDERDISVHPSCRACGLGRCSGQTPCASCGCGSLSSARPTGSEDGCPAAWRPRRRRAGGRPGSWPCRASAGARPCGACGRPCRS